MFPPGSGAGGMGVQASIARSLDVFSPMMDRLDQLTRAVQQLQALIHVESNLTRDACAWEFGAGFEDLRARMQALMNKLMRTSELVSDVHRHDACQPGEHVEHLPDGVRGPKRTSGRH